MHDDVMAVKPPPPHVVKPPVIIPRLCFFIRYFLYILRNKRLMHMFACCLAYYLRKFKLQRHFAHFVRLVWRCMYVKPVPLPKSELDLELHSLEEVDEEFEGEDDEV